MAVYKYEDFLKAVEDNGLAGGFSSADLALAQQNPDAGMGILSAKLDYKNAKTKEAKLLANQKAEDIRSSYGNYTGGGDGMEFNVGPISPSSFTAQETPSFADTQAQRVNDLQNQVENYGSFNSSLAAPTFQSDYTGKVDDLFNKQTNYGSFNYDQTEPTFNSNYTGELSDLYNQTKNYGEFNYDLPAPTYKNNYAGDIQNLYNQQLNYGDFQSDAVKPEYQNRYDDTINDLLNAVRDRGEFNYDPNTDPVYAAYRKQYAREGQRATADALGIAAAASGGIPSSYAQTAAGQQANYYAAQMTDKIPELYQLAYQRYLQEYAERFNALNAFQNAEQNDYAKYLNDVSQYNADRNFDLNLYNNRYNMLANNLATAQGLEGTEYARYLDQLNQYNNDKQFAYGQYMDRYNMLQNSLNNAETLDQMDYNRYLTQLDQFNRNKEFAYGQYVDDYNRLANDTQAARQLKQDDYNAYLAQLDQYNRDVDREYQQYTDRYNMLQNSLNNAQNASDTAYSRYIDSVNQNNIENNFAYQRLLDEVSTQTQREDTAYQRAQAEEEKLYNRNLTEEQNRLQLALVAAENGDYSLLREYGIDASNNPEAIERQYQLALAAAEYGDYSLLNALGIRPNLGNINNAALAGSGKYYGGSASIGSSGGSGGSGSSAKKSSTSPKSSDTTDETADTSKAKAKLQSGIAALEGRKQVSQAEYDALLSLDRGITSDMIKAAGITLEPIATITNSHGTTEDGDIDWIYVAGYGRLTAGELAKMVSRGEITETVKSDGKHSYAKNPNYKYIQGK